LLGSDQGPLVAPDAPVWKSVIAGTKGHGAIASETVGAESGDTFDDRAPDGALLVGLRAGYAQRGNNKEWYIHSLQAIYRTADGKRTLGRVCGATGDQMESYEAPPGYAVGVVHVSVRDLVEAISVTFSRITPNGLDQEDAGELYWHGRVGPPQERKDLGNKDRPILGLFGRGTHAIDLLGVYTAPK
jgi:hypothetical protein